MRENQIGPFFCSWSGGKDCCLALYHAIQRGGYPKFLVTMMTEEGARSRSHGLSINVIQQQAAALGIPLGTHPTTWANYEETFLDVLGNLNQGGISTGVFGDIDLAPHLEWVERICRSKGIKAYEPLWQRARQDLLKEFCQLGFTAIIIAVKETVLDSEFLGQPLNVDIISELKKAGIDPSGEEGEYHTAVIDGPLFSFPIRLEGTEQILRDGYRFLNVRVKKSE